MSKRTFQTVRAVLVIAVIAAIAGAASPAGQAKGISYSSLNQIQKRLISGSLAMSLVGAPTSLAALANAAECGNGNSGGDEPDEAPSCPPDSYSPAAGAGGGSTGGGNYTPSGSGRCSENHGNNVKVNQECLTVSDPNLQGRGQAQNETSIAVDPKNAESRRREPERLPPRRRRLLRRLLTRTAARTGTTRPSPTSFTYGDVVRAPILAGGRGYVGRLGLEEATRTSAASCSTAAPVVSQNPDQSSAFVVLRSTGNNGASWNFPGRYSSVNLRPERDGRRRSRTRSCMAVDSNASSPYRDRIYVTWTEFAAGRVRVHLRDALQRLRRDVLRAGARERGQRDVPRDTYGAGTPNGNCNENQFSDPFVGPDGSLYVVYSNFNNAVSGSDNRNQVMLARSTDGGVTFEHTGQGQRLLRPARLRYVPGRRRRLRTGPACRRRARRTFRSSGRRTMRRAQSTRRTRTQVVVTVGLVHQQGLEGVERVQPG